MSRRTGTIRVVWRLVAALTLTIGVVAPIWGAGAASAQESLPSIAGAVPESAVVFSWTDLDREGAQWQQAEALLARVGLPDALGLWENAVLEEGEQSGDITQAELDALLRDCEGLHRPRGHGHGAPPPSGVCAPQAPA